jgi:ribosomal protein S18 acetylase RimI-like enzyme
MSTLVTDFSTEEHLEEVLDVLLRVRQSDSQYPPPVDAGFGRDSMSAWLLGDRPLAKWVALDQSRVVGYVQVTEPHSYLPKISEAGAETGYASSRIAEIGKFFVDPASQRGGVGQLLFDTARAFIRSRELMAVLAVVETSRKAVAFYESHGMRLVTTFEGAHGTNLVYADGAGADRIDG